MNIYVGNLSYRTTEDELNALFAEYGSIKNVTIIKDRETGNSKGFGFVEMEQSEAGQNAINAINGSEVGGRNLRVNEARPRT